MTSRTRHHGLTILATGAALSAGITGTATAQQQIDATVDLAFNRYYDYDQMTDAMQRLAAAHPDVCSLISIGKSVEDRDMWVLTINDPATGDDLSKPAMWIDGNIHGNELQAAETVLYTAWYLLEGRDEVPAIAELVKEGEIDHTIASRVVTGKCDAHGASRTLVPVRPRWRGERRSLRTFPGVSLRPALAFNPRPRRLSTPLLTPLNSTPTFARMERPSGCLLINVTARSIKARNCVIYNVVDDSEDGLVLPDGAVLTNVFVPGREKLVQSSSTTTDGGKVFKVRLTPNPFSFEGVYKMNQSTDVKEAYKLGAEAHADLAKELKF